MSGVGKLSKKWKVKYSVKLTGKSDIADIIDILLTNRGLEKPAERKEFLKPSDPHGFSFSDLGVDKKNVERSIGRIKKTKTSKEKIIIYGDYDADGVCATAILWEALFALGYDILPYIPERFSEGYGLNTDTLKKLKKDYPELGLIITVDNGIVARKEVDEAKKLGIDVIISDHHLKGKNYPDAFSIIHTEVTSGSGIAWTLAQEIRKRIKDKLPVFGDGLELASIGTIADQIPLIGINRSIVKYGLEYLRNTRRPGLNELIKESAIEKRSISTVSINYMIAPRINAMGRISHALDSLRLLCTKDANKAQGLAMHIGKTNSERQKIVSDVVLHARTQTSKKEWEGMIIISDSSYHEGVIGLAAAKLAEEYYRPAVVISQGKKYSKGSARSIAGFNIIETIRMAQEFLIDGGGHPMAAGFTVETERLSEFTQKLDTVSKDLLTEELLTPHVSADMYLEFKNISYPLVLKLKEFEPFGIGNPAPVFITERVDVVSSRTVGSTAKHLKLKLEKDGKHFDAIGFGMGEKVANISQGTRIDIIYNIEENVWNGNVDIQLKLKDIRIGS